MAARQGLRLLKSRRRDRYASGYGTYVLVAVGEQVAPDAGTGFGCDLDEIEHQLTAKQPVAAHGGLDGSRARD